MGKVAFVFPGQGSQAVGMGRDAYEQHEGAKAIFEKADRTLDVSLSDLIFHGPEEELKQTTNTQPALLTTSIALLEAFKETGIKADYVAGHSLGEYSALVAAGAMSFENAVSTVRARGQFMEEAVPRGQGAMAAVLGATRENLQILCAEVTEDGNLVELANMNCPGQIVVSGSTEGVQTIVERGKEAGARRVIPLEVSGPFHSSLMEPAAKRLASVLANTAIHTPAIPVIGNVTAKQIESAAQIKSLLERQVVSPVLWEDSIVWMIEQGVTTFFEIGSGNVLAGLIKKIDRQVNVYSINDMASIRGEFNV